MNKIFIVGCARSGTSILGELIAAHPEVTYFFEQHSTWELGGMGENESHRLLAKHATEAVKAQIQAWFQEHAQNAVTLVEKNPRNILRIPYVKSIFPDAKFIHIIRDGRDVACSMVPGCGGEEWRHLKPPSWMGFYKNYVGAIRCAHAWKESVEIGLSDLQAVEHIQVRYEDLLRSPLDTAARIFEFIGLASHPAVHDFCKLITNSTSNTYHAKIQTRWYRDDHTERIGRWRENLTPAEMNEVNKILQPLLGQLGYPAG